MPKQRESNIGDFAFDYLRSYYAGLHSTETILVSKAETTKKGATASGLFALTATGNTVFVATLDTQRSHKIADILTRYKKQGLSKSRFITLFVLFAAALFLNKTIGHGIMLYVLPVIVALTGFVLHALLEKAYLKRRLTQLVDALKQTPANEQWLGISISSLIFRHNALAGHLIDVCSRRGIGLITVGKRAKIVQLQAPRTTTSCRRRDFLSYYVAEDQLRQALRDDALLRVA